MKMVQFIAGATCPSCGAKDTIAINAENNLIYCVKCNFTEERPKDCLLYTSPSPRDRQKSRMPSSA